MEREIAAQEERTRRIKEGVVRKFRVSFAVSGTVEREVWAVDEAEARELAELESADVDPFELDVDVYNVKEVTG